LSLFVPATFSLPLLSKPFEQYKTYGLCDDGSHYVGENSELEKKAQLNSCLF